MSIRRKRPSLSPLALAIPFVFLSAWSLADTVTNPVPEAQAADTERGVNASGSDALSKLESDDALDLEFIPPVDGAPGDRIGAGTRSAGILVQRIILLAPQGGGLTASSTPKLYWWLAEDFTGSAEYKVQAFDDDTPVLQLKQDIEQSSGLQSLDLEKFGSALEEGKIYIWKVQLTNAKGVVWASEFSFVERVPSVDADGKADTAKNVKDLAAKGIWYDALAQLIGDPKLEALQQRLLESAGLNIPAAK